MAKKPTPKPAKSRAELLAEFYALPIDARIDEGMLAAVLFCSTAKLQRDRVFGGGIPFVREGGKLTADKNGNTRIFGGRIFYIKRDVLGYLEANNRTVTSTSAISAASGATA